MATKHMTAAPARKRPAVNRARMDATDDVEIARQIDIDPETAPDVSSLGRGEVRMPASAGFIFEVFQDTGDEFRFRLRAPDGEIMLVSEPYRARALAEGAVRAVKEELSLARVEYLS